MLKALVSLVFTTLLAGGTAPLLALPPIDSLWLLPIEQQASPAHVTSFKRLDLGNYDQSDIVDGKPTPMHWRYRDGALQKYFYDASGNETMYSQYETDRILRQRALYGNHGPRLRAILPASRDSDRIPVSIQFALDDIAAISPVSMTDQRLDSLRHAIHARSLAKLQSLLGPKLPTATTSPDLLSTDITLTKSQLQLLRSLPEFASVELQPSSLQAPIVPTMLQQYGSYYSLGGMEIQPLLDSSINGTGITVAALEAFGFPTSLLSSFHSFTRYAAPQKSNSPDTLHGALVLSVIHNAVGSGLYHGGSPGVTSLFYAGAHRDSGFVPPYQWLRPNFQTNKAVLNCSWEYRVYAGGDTGYAARYMTRYFDRKWDIDAVTAPYITTVLAAGNNNRTANWPQFVACTSAGWSPSQCEVTHWNGYNTITVGSTDAARNATSFSSWRNGPDSFATDPYNCYHLGNETPHLAAKGDNVISPLGYYCSGTSFSSPAVASFAANLKSRYANLYPWNLRGVMMASASAADFVAHDGLWPSGAAPFPDQQDQRDGAGIPTAYSHIAKRVAAAYCTGTNITPPLEPGSTLNRYGYFDFIIAPNIPAGRTMTRTINIKAMQGYMQFLLTWMSSPDAVTSDGQMSTADDLNLFVSSTTGDAGWSSSARNTTERVGLYHPNEVQYTYTVTITIAVRRNTSRPIYGCLAWVPNGSFRN